MVWLEKGDAFYNLYYSFVYCYMGRHSFLCAGSFNNTTEKSGPTGCRTPFFVLLEI